MNTGGHLIKSLIAGLLLCEMLAIFPSYAIIRPTDPPESAFTSEFNRRKPGRKKGMFAELEVFKHNLDIFAGPGYHSGSGPFLDELVTGFKTGQTNFGSTIANSNANFFIMTGGVQYRMCPGHKARGFQNLLSYALGVSYLRRGFEYDFEKKGSKNSAEITDNLIVSNKIRANYLAIPLSVRLGRRIFIEAGTTIDVLIKGSSISKLERNSGLTSISDDNSSYLPTFGINDRVAGLRQVVPFARLGMILSGGFYFDENIGIRFCANINNGFFKQNTNPDNTNFGSTTFSIQLTGCLNTNKL